ncbi:MAG TPA: class I SAM-dependent methyltransferase [Nocardioidaceae bacterium]|nr:class I SAM-dependent methyltransferase [Nocardioidaceae bacterium]
MAWWTDRVVPHLADVALGTGPVHKLREQVCADLSGRVVEIGFGSGLNVSHYPAAVTAVDAIEPSGVGWGMAASRVAEAPITIRRAGLDGQVIEAPEASYDSALSTFTLCTIPDVKAALAEVHRVLVPGGTFHFLEHGRSPSDRVARWQHRLTPVQRRVAGGCHLDRQIARVVEAAGFEIEELTNDYLPGPSPTRVFGYIYLGTARAR